jgi:hypothetical protein
MILVTSHNNKTQNKKTKEDGTRSCLKLRSMDSIDPIEFSTKFKDP